MLGKKGIPLCVIVVTATYLPLAADDAVPSKHWKISKKVATADGRDAAVAISKAGFLPIVVLLLVAESDGGR